MTFFNKFRKAAGVGLLLGSLAVPSVAQQPLESVPFSQSVVNKEKSKLEEIAKRTNTKVEDSRTTSVIVYPADACGESFGVFSFRDDGTTNNTEFFQAEEYLSTILSEEAQTFADHSTPSQPLAGLAVNTPNTDFTSVHGAGSLELYLDPTSGSESVSDYLMVDNDAIISDTASGFGLSELLDSNTCDYSVHDLHAMRVLARTEKPKVCDYILQLNNGDCVNKTIELGRNPAADSYFMMVRAYDFDFPKRNEFAKIKIDADITWKNGKLDTYSLSIDKSETTCDDVEWDCGLFFTYPQPRGEPSIFADDNSAIGYQQGDWGGFNKTGSFSNLVPEEWLSPQ